ncbi:methyltransferase [Pontibacter sp. JAM-7]|uniref:methyltransferase n=1 Tax=Pontibacter sp. JAM-7 TaxID=3366581 RepID=UPI003AF5D7F0
MSLSDVNPIHRINELYWGFAISRAIHVAAKLGIADHVTAGGTSVNNIAASTNLNQDRLYRLMRLLASYQIFAETEKGVFVPTPLSDVLTTAGDNSVRDAAHLVTKSMWEAYGHLEHSIQTGEDTYTELFGKGVFEYLDEHAHESEQFSRAMHNYAELENPLIAESCPLQQAVNVVDVGGGQGGFLDELLEAHKHISGLLFDQPHVVADVNPTARESERFAIVGGSFFDAVPSGADAYFLKRILHDWNDDDCCKILSSVKAAMKTDSRIFVIDAIVPAGNVPHFSKDLEAFLLTWGGQERDRDEFEQLFARVGLQLASVIETPTALSILEVKLASQ